MFIRFRQSTSSSSPSQESPRDQRKYNKERTEAVKDISITNHIAIQLSQPSSIEQFYKIG